MRNVPSLTGLPVSTPPPSEGSGNYATMVMQWAVAKLAECAPIRADPAFRIRVGTSEDVAVVNRSGICVEADDAVIDSDLVVVATCDDVLVAFAKFKAFTHLAQAYMLIEMTCTVRCAQRKRVSTILRLVGLRVAHAVGSHVVSLVNGQSGPLLRSLGFETVNDLNDPTAQYTEEAWAVHTSTILATQIEFNAFLRHTDIESAIGTSLDLISNPSTAHGLYCADCESRTRT